MRSMMVFAIVALVVAVAVPPFYNYMDEDNGLERFVYSRIREMIAAAPATRPAPAARAAPAARPKASTSAAN